MPSPLPPPGHGDTFTASDGKELFFETWEPEEGVAARAEVLFFHGVHESADTKTARRLAARATAAGLRFRALEDHAHGRSVRRCRGTHGLVDSFETLVGHSRDFLSHVRALWRGGGGQGAAAAVGAAAVGDGDDEEDAFRVFLVGHSMGGATAALLADVLADEGVAPAGVVLLAPALLCTPPPQLTVAALTAVSWLLPSAPLGPPEHGEMYDTGSGLGLNYGGRMRLQTGKLFLDLHGAVEAALARGALLDPVPGSSSGSGSGGGGGGSGHAAAAAEAPRLPGGGRLALDFPLLVVHGAGDGAVPLSGSERLLAHAQSRDKELRVLDGRGHQFLCQRGWQGVAAGVFEWIAARLP